MSKIPKDLESKIQKLLALARRGIGGERVNAQKILDTILTANGLTIADFDDETTSSKPYYFYNMYQKDVLFQLVGKVAEINSIPFTHIRKARNHVYFRLTRVQHAELAFLWHIYQIALNDHIALATQAFIQANELFGPPSDTPMDINDAADIMEMLRMARATKPTSVRTAIEAT